MLATGARIAICIAAVTLSAEARASGTVEGLLDQCKSDQAIGKMSCFARIFAIGQMMTMNGLEIAQVPMEDSEARRWLQASGLCTKNKEIPSAPAMVQAFLNNAEKHPENWPDDVLVGVTDALRAAWPCPL